VVVYREGGRVERISPRILLVRGGGVGRWVVWVYIKRVVGVERISPRILLVMVFSSSTAACIRYAWKMNWRAIYVTRVSSYSTQSTQST